LATLDDVKNLTQFPSLTSLTLTGNPIADEKGDEMKKEVLILFDFKIKTFNGEEVSADDVNEAKELQANRIREAEEAKNAPKEEEE